MAIIADGADATPAARRTEEMFEHFFNVAKVLDCEPEFIKSTGDGLMSVWHLKRENAAARADKIVTLALRLCNQLPKWMADAWGDQRLSIGLGLSWGSLVCLNNGKFHDYFGAAANVAAKCQDSARPEGLIVAGDFLKLISADKHEELFSGLKPQLFAKDVPGKCRLYDFKVQNCGQTSSVRFPVEWTCLAWPGFSITSESLTDGDRPAPIGLNREGITVVTHEGLKGNIGTLAIWPRYTPVTAGDRFEIIIDDFDTLAMLQRQGAIVLYQDRNKIVRKRLRKMIVDQAFDQVEKASGFAFIPIRCGVNALCANVAQEPWLKLDVRSIRSYGRVRDLIENGTLSPNRIGLYDNMGASMPILIMMMLGDSSVARDEVFNLPVGTLLKRLRSLLGSLKDVGRPPALFRWYATRDTLALDIQEGNIDLVLGGGAWLGRPVEGEDADPPLVCHIPQDDGGFLWVEGAALSPDENKQAAEKQAGELLEFLTQTVLTEEYQIGLANGSPYGSSPVVGKVIRRVQKNMTAERAGPGFIDAETRRIYRANGRVDIDLLTIRRCPKRYPEWLEAWEKVKRDCCEPRV